MNILEIGIQKGREVAVLRPIYEASLKAAPLYNVEEAYKELCKKGN